MRFLVDQNLSPFLADELRAVGHDVVHTRDIDLRTAVDEVVLRRALDEDRVLISADTDFGFLLAESGADRPSVVLLRLRTPRSAARLAAMLVANLESVAADLAVGADGIAVPAPFPARRGLRHSAPPGKPSPSAIAALRWHSPSNRRSEWIAGGNGLATASGSCSGSR